jgi:hypothetical protein
MQQIYNILITYQCFEDLLYNFAGKERKRSIFCVPVGNTSYYRDTKRILFSNEFPGWSKYTGLNLAPLHEYGTLEFRHLRGTHDKSVVFQWLHILYSLYNFAINKDTDELEQLIIEASNRSDFFGLGYAVFGPHFFALTNNTNYQKKMTEDFAISKLFMDKQNIQGAI